MALNRKQNDLLQDFKKNYKRELANFAKAPDEIRDPWLELWDGFESVANFDDKDQASLAAFGAVSLFAAVAQELPEADLRKFLSLYTVSLLEDIEDPTSK